MSVLQWVPVKSSLTCNNYVFVNIFSLPFSEQWNEAYSVQCFAVINNFNQHPWSRCLRWPVLGSGQLTCVMCHVTCPHPGLPDRAEKHQVFIYKKGTLCSAHDAISFCRPQFAPLSACPRSIRYVARCGVRRWRTCSPPWSRPWCCSSH